MRVFISSTIETFSDLRAKLVLLLRQHHFEVFLSEFEGPRWKSSAVECLREVSNCDIFVSVFGPDYGSVPEASSEAISSDIFDGKTSVTHGEYRFAKKLNKPILIYVKNTQVEDVRQRDFISEVEHFFAGEFRYKFDNDQEILDRIIQDLFALTTQLVRGDYRYPSMTPFKIVFCDEWHEVAEVGARGMLEVIQQMSNPCLSLTSGRTVSAVYRQFIELYSKSSLGNLFSRVEIFSNNEYFGVGPSNPRSIRGFLLNSFLYPLEKSADIKLHTSDKIHFLPGVIEQGSLDNLCAEYDALIGQAVVNLQILGACPIGTTLFVEPGLLSLPELLNQRTSLVYMSEHSFNYGFPKPVSRYVMTIGIGNVLSRSQELMVLLYGQEKADITRQLLLGPIDSNNPTLALRTHQDLTIAFDKKAASKLPKDWETRFDVQRFRTWREAHAGNRN